jgi:hypothetical protein
MTFTELKSDRVVPYETGPRAYEDAFIVGMQLKGYREFQFWECRKRSKPGHVEPESEPGGDQALAHHVLFQCLSRCRHSSGLTPTIFQNTRDRCLPS